MKDSMSVRPATFDDIEKLVQLEKLAHPKGAWRVEGFKAEMEKPYARLMLLTDDETDEILYAYICYWIFMGEMYVLNLVVDPKLRRQGLAKWLIRLAMSEADRANVNRRYLEVRVSNESAIRLYQTFGFEITSRRKAFYSDSEDAFVLEWGPRPNVSSPPQIH